MISEIWFPTVNQKENHCKEKKGELCLSKTCNMHVGDAVASRLVRSSPDRVVRGRALAGGIVFFS